MVATDNAGQAVTLSFFPPDPAYGDGVYRRRVRLIAPSPRAVAAQLDDDYHALWCRLDHDGAVVTGVTGGFQRAPTTMCGGAPAVLAELIGMSLDTPPAVLFADGRARRNCTHLFDLAQLLLGHARRPPGERRYDVAVPDARDGTTVATVARDGAVVHRWRITGDTVGDPAELAGRPLLGGFSRALVDTYRGDTLEAALVLHRGWFVSQARTVLADPPEPYRLIDRDGQGGTCHAYSGTQLVRGWSIPGNRRDYTAGLTETPLPPEASA